MPPGLSPAAIALVFAFLLVPGFGITFAIQPPGSASLSVRTGLAFAFGYATIALTSLALALLHELSPGPFLVSAGLVTVAAWALALRRAGEHLRALRDDLAGQWIRYVTLLGVLAGAIVVRATYAPIVNFVPTTLRYWADGVEIADAHAIPSTTLQWGHLLQPTVSKVALNTFNATMSLFLGREPLGSAGALLFVVSIGLVLVGYALAEELGVRWLAPLVPLLLFLNDRIGNTELTSDLHQNLAEDWGRLAMFAALVLAVRALKPAAEPEGSGEDDHRVRSGAVTDGILAGTMFGVAAGTHLIPTAAGLAFAGAYAIMRMIVDHGVVRVLRTSAAALIVAAVVGGLVLVLPKGDLGFKGAQGSAAYQKMIHDLGLPPTFDPTEFLVFGTVEAASRVYPYSPSHVVRDFTYQVLHQNSSDEAAQRLPVLKALLPSALAVLGVVILIVFGGADLRAMAGAAVIFTIVLIAVSLGFAARYHLYALETFGNRRLFNYIPIPLVLILTGVGELGLRMLRRRFSQQRSQRSWIPAVTSVVVAAAVGALLVPSTHVLDARLRAEPGLELVTWIGQHDPCRGYILTDRRTLATFEATVGRAAVLEGMGPHVRPDVLELAIQEMFRAGDFFEDPEAGLDYLRSRGVAYVVTTNEFVVVHSLGGWRRVGPSDPLRLARVPFLHAVFANNAGTVYQVEGFTPSPSAPNPADQPGYCRA